MAALEPGTARIRHPDPDVQDAVVPASAVPEWERNRWEFVEGDREDLPREYQKYEGQPERRIYHPGLDRYEHVAESAVPEWRSRGWVPADDVEQADLEAKKVAELRELAKERGISPIPTTKAELIEALNDQEQTQAGDEPAQDSKEDEG
jgi:hypothetical protein